jgi:hypothetical protein
MPIRQLLSSPELPVRVLASPGIVILSLSKDLQLFLRFVLSDETCGDLDGFKPSRLEQSPQPSRSNAKRAPRCGDLICRTRAPVR